MIININKKDGKEIITESAPKSVLLYHPKIQNPWKVGNAIQSLKNKYPDTRIGFTNGKFRKLTPAHIVFLNLCKTRCNILIVAINSDYSLRLLKEFSPFSDRERAFMIANLDITNYVVLFDEENPYKIINEINPDVIFKGNDYKDKEVISANKPVEIIDILEMQEHLNDIEKSDKDNEVTEYKYFKVDI